MNKFLVGGLALLLAWSVVRNFSPPAAKHPEQLSPKEAANPFYSHLLEISQTYEVFGRQDTVIGWFDPFRDNAGFTGMMVINRPVQPRFSVSNDPGSHGRRLYSLFVKDFSGYASSSHKGGTSNPVGQVVVMETWAYEDAADFGVKIPVIRHLPVHRGDAIEIQVDRFLPYARTNGKLYRAWGKEGLFILFKLDPQTPGTDEGWVYGTVTADGKQVTSAGRVEACMSCHQRAPYDRLFGMPVE